MAGSDSTAGTTAPTAAGAPHRVIRRKSRDSQSQIVSANAANITSSEMAKPNVIHRGIKDEAIANPVIVL
jgi:hypothetical protein